MGKIAAVCISEKKGTAKMDIRKCLLIKEFGAAGDAHAGSERQISLLPLESVVRFRQSTENIDIPYGTFGENLLIEGIEFEECHIGTKLRCGEALLEIIQIGKKCHENCEIRKKTGNCIMPKEGIFANVLEGGYVRVGDSVDIVKSEPFRVCILTASDRAYYGGYEDVSGKVIKEICKADNYMISETVILPDDEEIVYRELVRMSDEIKPDIIFTTGGTGFSVRDRVPEATLRTAERNAHGIAEAIRMHSLKITPNALLSRAESVIRGRTLIINLPGSPKAVKECLEFILPVIKHGIELLRGEADN